MAGSVYETAEGSTIEISCDGNSLTVNGIKMVLKKDIVATNGVIHRIDQVLIPNSGNSEYSSPIICLFVCCFCDHHSVLFMFFLSAKDVMELMGDSQSTFKDMASELGLAAAIGPKTEYTVLAPVNAAFTCEFLPHKYVGVVVQLVFNHSGSTFSELMLNQNHFQMCNFVLCLSDEVKSKDQNLLKLILENHFLKLKVTLSELYNGQLLETLAGKLLRVFIYRTVRNRWCKKCIVGHKDCKAPTVTIVV